MIAKVFFAAVSIALVQGVPKPEAAVITAPQVAYAAAPVVVTRTVAPVSARIAVAPVAQVAAVAPVATSTSSQYFTRTYNGVTTYAVAAPVASVVDTRARYVAAAPSQVVVASAPQVLVRPAQFVGSSSQVVTHSFNGLPAVTYYTVPTYTAAPVAVGVSPVAAPVPSAPVAPPTQSSTEVEVLDA